MIFVHHEVNVLRDILLDYPRDVDVFPMDNIDAVGVPLSGYVTQSKSLKVYMERYRSPRACILSANNISRRNTVRYLPLYAAGRL
jgi:hypothetical protein